MDRPVRRIALVGPPGSWRKPHARRLGRALEVPVLSVGALIDNEGRQRSRAGLAAAAAIERGELAPDTVVCELLAPRLASMTNGWVLDGFPRTELEPHVRVCTVSGTRSSPELSVDLLHASTRAFAPA